MNESDQKIVAGYVGEIEDVVRGKKYGLRQAVDRFVDWLVGQSLGLKDLRVLHLDEYMASALYDGGPRIVRHSPTIIRELLKRHYLEYPAPHVPTAGWRAKRVIDDPGQGAGPRPGQQNAHSVYSVPALFEIFQASKRMAQAAKGDKRIALFKGLAAAELVYSTGMTLKELSALRFQHLDTAERGVLYVGENSCRKVPFTPAAHAAVNAWIYEAEPYGRPSDGGVFYGVRKLQSDTPNNIGLSISRLGKALATPEASKLSQTALRWACGAHLLNAGARPDLVAYVLGIENVSGLNAFAIKARQIADASAPTQ